MTGAAHDLAVPDVPVERHELACGATLLVSPRPAAPVAALHVHVRGGHALDPPGKEGVANLAGALVDQGTAARSEEEIAATLEPAGGGVQGDAHGIAGTIAAGEWRLLVDLVAEMIVSPRYPQAKFERQRTRLLERLVVERDDPRVQGSWRFKELVYGDHWLGRSDAGRIETVASIERRDLARFHRENWVARRAVVAFCGDVEPGLVREHLDRRLAAWRPGAPLEPAEPRFPRLAPRVAAFRARRQQVHLHLGHLGVRRADPDFPAVLVLDHVLGSGPGFTSRLTRILRDELGLAYTVHAAMASSSGVLPGTFSAYIGTSPEHVETAVFAFLREMRRVREEPVAPDELALARSYVLGSFALGFERASRRASYAIFSERCGLGPGHLEELLRACAEVTPDDLLRVARTHLRPDTPCVVAAGPITKAELQRVVREALGQQRTRGGPRRARERAARRSTGRSRGGRSR